MRYLLLFVVLLSPALAGCGRVSRAEAQTTDVNIVLEINPDPPGVGPAHLTLFVTSADGTPIDGARLSIKGDMTHAGMQPILAETEGGEEGRYEAPFEWTMGGDWIVTVTAALPDGRTASRQFTYLVEGDLCGIDDKALEMTEKQ